MPSATDENGDMDEAQMLAPWYVAGKLEQAETRLVEELAYRDKEFAKLIAEAKQEAEAIASVNEAAGVPSSALWARIERSVEQDRKAQRHQWFMRQANALADAVSGFFAGLSGPQWQAVAAAAVAICVLEAGAIGYMASSETPAKFHVASGPKAQTAPKRSAFIVTFRDTATIAEISKTLDDAGATMVEGPNADMVYRLGLRSDSLEAKDRAYAKLQSSGLTKLILPEK
jgi:anti-sigma-K factor RskA